MANPLLFTAILLVAAAPARAVHVTLQTPQEPVSAHATFEIAVIVEDATNVEPPEVPQLTGAEIRAAGRNTSFSQIGRTITRRTVFTYRVTAAEPGRLTLPPFTVRADGGDYTTRTATITVERSPLADRDDLLLVEVNCPRPYIYVGQRVPLTLQIWVKPPEAYGVTLEPDTLAAYVNTEASRFAPFQRIERVARLERDTADGPTPYYVYEGSVNYLGQTPGRVDFSAIRVVIEYPTRFRAALGEIRPVSTEPVVAYADDDLLVKALPAEGRPELFNGAVGVFEFTTRTTAKNVRVGDPIPLTLTIRGSGALDSVSPPQLADHPELTRDFEVSLDNPGGVIEGTRKRFSATLRAKHAGVDEIPPLRFAYFDPFDERYQVVSSAAIPLTVENQRSVSDDAIQGLAEAPIPDAKAARTLRANRVAPRRMLASTWVPSPVLVLTVVAGGPAICLLIAGVVGFARRRQTDSLRQRRRLALGELKAALECPLADTARSEADHLGQALRACLAQYLDLPIGHLTEGDRAPRLEQAGLSASVAARCTALLAQCEQASYGAATTTPAELRQEAQHCFELLRQERLR